MTQTITIEIDTPPSIYLSSNEFTGILIERQLHRPLFAENLTSVHADLVSTHDRIGERTWVFRVDQDATWSDGVAITADDIARRVLDLTHQPRGSWLTRILGRCEVLDSRTVAFETRQRVAALDRVLASPALSPRSGGRSSGAYRVSRVEQLRSTLVPRQAENATIELVTTSSRSEGRFRFLNGELDVAWGIGVPPEFWNVDDPGPFLADSDLDMYLVAVAGRGVPASHARSILAGLKLGECAPAGMEPTTSRFCSIERPFQHCLHKSASAAPRWPLLYSDFPPNREVADCLATESRGRLVPMPIPYSVMLAGEIPPACFSLQVHASLFPDPLGLLVEGLALAGDEFPAGVSRREMVAEAWAMPDEKDRRSTLFAAEAQVDRALRRRVLGRIRPRFRSRIPFELPRSGLFDFTRLSTERTAYGTV